MAVKDQEKSKTKTFRVAGGVSRPKPKARAARPKTRTSVAGMTPAKVSEFRRDLQLTQLDFARLLPVSVRTLASLEAGAAPTEAIARKFVELERLANSLAEVMRRDTIGSWLKTPNAAFEGLKPLEVIERGEIDRLWSMIFVLRSGVPS